MPEGLDGYRALPANHQPAREPILSSPATGPPPDFDFAFPILATRHFSLATARPTLYLRSNAGQFSSTLIELDSVRAGVTAKICWPSAVTSNMGAGVSARFI